MEFQLSDCPECRGGELLNPSTGKIEACPTCRGVGVTTPGTICQCGRSCADESGGLFFCGNADCLKALKESKRIDEVRSAAWSRPHTSYTPQSAVSRNVGFYEDGDFPGWRGSMVH